VSGLQAPWFGLRLRRGNSLIGARRAVYTRAQVNDKSWLKATPTVVPITGMTEELRNETTAHQTDGRIHHFLLPASGWGSAVEVKEAKEAVSLAAEAVAGLKKWRSGITGKPTTKQLNALVELAHRVESTWQIALRRLQIAEAEARRGIALWGRDCPGHTQAVTREQIEETLGKRNGVYQRLRRVMDAWAALWFWPLTDTGGITPPTSLDRWIEACQLLLGREPEARKSSKGMTPLGAATNWDDLNDAENLNLSFAGAVDVDEALSRHPWLKVCEKIAEQQGFFHWELDFATVFARGGFDLQLGNPPWVRPRTDLDMLLAEGDPWWQLAVKPSEEARKTKLDAMLALPGIRDLVVHGTSDVVVTIEYLGAAQSYPLLEGLQPDLYRCFMEQTWRHSSHRGVTTLVHPETHFTDERAGMLREQTYRRLRRHWQFINELRLYEIHDQVRYGVHVYGSPRATMFIMASSLYHPGTVDRSLRHDGSGDEPGLKDPGGNWDVRPHRKRVIDVTDETLGIWHSVMEDIAAPVRQTRMVYTVNTTAADVLATLSPQPRVGALDLQFSEGWHESRDRKKGYFESRWAVPSSWDDVILQGPHLFVATPAYKSPNPTMKSNQDWSAIDFESLPADGIPATAYQPTGDPAQYSAGYTQWEAGPARAYYRTAWRRMAGNGNERTLISAIIPPGTAHVDPVSSAGTPQGGIESLCVASGFLSSMIADFTIRAAPKNDIRLAAVNRLPIIIGHHLQGSLLLRVLRLNCITNSYADLWRDVYRAAFTGDRWASGRERENRPLLGPVEPDWAVATPLRIAEDRRQALVEIDALVALMLGVSADQLCTIYRTQFAVLYGYDHNSYVYDAHGRLVPNSVLSVWRKKGDALTVAERTATNQAGYTYTYELPFRLLDREADMRTAYAEFERRLAAMTGTR
jgi:hypothetical protein